MRVLLSNLRDMVDAERAAKLGKKAKKKKGKKKGKKKDGKGKSKKGRKDPTVSSESPDCISCFSKICYYTTNIQLPKSTSAKMHVLMVNWKLGN